MTQWEYKRFNFHSYCNLEDKPGECTELALNNLGEDGWEVYTQEQTVHECPDRNGETKWTLSCWAKRLISKEGHTNG